MTLGFNSRSFSRGYIIPTKKCQRPITPTANRLQEHLGWKLFYLQRRNLQKLHCRQSIRITVGSGWKGSFSTKNKKLHFLSKLAAYAIHMAKHHCWFSRCFKASKYQYCRAGGTKLSSNHPDLICPFASFNNLWRHARMLGTGICRGQLHPNIEVTGNNVAMRYQAPVIPFHVPGNDSPRHCPKMIWMSLAPKKLWYHLDSCTRPIKCSCPIVGTLWLHNKVALAVGNKIDVKPLFLKYVIFTCPTFLGCHLANLEHDVILWDISGPGLLAPDAHRVARLFELGFLRWCGPKRRTPLHIRHHGLLRRFQRSSAKAPYGDSLIPMVIVYFQNTSRNPRRFWNPKSLEVEGNLFQ